MAKEKSEIKFEVTQELGVIEDPYNPDVTMVKQLNMVSWNDKTAKADIRGWNEDRSKMTKGITMNVDELKSLKALLDSIDLDSLEE